MTSAPNGQKIRSLATQTALMEATENLFSDQGIHNVSAKDILREARQKNESALQYHFKNLQGLVNAIHRRRSQQTQEKRAELLTEKASATQKLTLRDLCELMVYPTFLLAKSDPQFRKYAAAFSHEIVLAEDSALIKVSQSGGGGESGVKLGYLLREALPHLDETTYRARMDLAVRMCSAAVGNHMQQKKPLKGAAAELFIDNLLDALEGLLSAKVKKRSRAD